MRSTHSIRRTTALTNIPNGSLLVSLSTMEPKAQGKAMTSSIPGLAESLDMRPKELRRKSGPALAGAEAALELLLLRYLSKPKISEVSSILLATHLSILLRRHPQYCNLSKQSVHRIVCRLAASQLSLFYP